MVTLAYELDQSNEKEAIYMGLRLLISQGGAIAELPCADWQHNDGERDTLQLNINPVSRICHYTVEESGHETGTHIPASFSATVLIGGKNYLNSNPALTAPTSS